MASEKSLNKPCYDEQRNRARHHTQRFPGRPLECLDAGQGTWINPPCAQLYTSSSSNNDTADLDGAMHPDGQRTLVAQLMLHEEGLETAQHQTVIDQQNACTEDRE